MNKSPTRIVSTKQTSASKRWAEPGVVEFDVASLTTSDMIISPDAVTLLS